MAEATPDPGDDPRALPLVHGETLMVVDDDRVHLLRDEEMLAALGYEPVGFTPPHEAVVACRKDPQRFHALMIGHLGPAKTALELAAALHAAVPGLPIVVATASVNEIDADAAVTAEGFEIVRRPLVSSEIAAALKRGLARQTGSVGVLGPSPKDGPVDER